MARVRALRMDLGSADATTENDLARLGAHCGDHWKELARFRQFLSIFRTHRERPQLAPLLGPFLSEAVRRATALNRLKTGYGLHAPQKADSEIFNKFGPASGRGRCTMRNRDFVSDEFLALTAAGLVLLCSGLLAIAFS